jgi:hypothetical protein
MWRFCAPKFKGKGKNDEKMVFVTRSDDDSFTGHFLHNVSLRGSGQGVNGSG